MNYKLDAIKTLTKMRDIPKVSELPPPDMEVVESGLLPWVVLEDDPDPGIVDPGAVVGAGVKSPLQP